MPQDDCSLCVLVSERHSNLMTWTEAVRKGRDRWLIWIAVGSLLGCAFLVKGGTPPEFFWAMDNRSRERCRGRICSWPRRGKGFGSSLRESGANTLLLHWHRYLGDRVDGKRANPRSVVDCGSATLLDSWLSYFRRAVSSSAAVVTRYSAISVIACSRELCLKCVQAGRLPEGNMKSLQRWLGLWWISWFGIIGGFLMVGIGEYRHESRAASQFSITLMIVTVLLWIVFSWWMTRRERESMAKGTRQ